MTRTRVRMAIALVAVIAVQECIVPLIHVFGAYPDLVVGFVAAAGLAGGPQSGAFTGFAAGMAEDLFLQTPFGLSALVYTLVGFAVGSLQSAVPVTAPSMVSLVTSLASAVGVISFELLGALLGQTAMLEASLGAAVCVVGLGNFVMGMPLAMLVRWAGPVRGLLAPSSLGAPG